MSKPIKLKVKVTQQHIEDGIPENTRSCPIALATNEHKQVLFSDVDKTEMFFMKHNVAAVDWDDPKYDDTDGSVTQPVWAAQLPPQAAEFVDKFDRGEKVEPFEFEIELHRTTMEFCDPEYADSPTR